MQTVFDRLSGGRAESVDQRIVLHGISWEQYVSLSDALGERPSPRMYYLEGELELMANSFPHEYVKTTLARCLELWALETDVALHGAGSFTLRNRRRRRAAEADECYYVGTASEHRPPDLAIEVVWTHGGLDKLAIYRGLGVTEVWFWKDDELTIHVLERDKWVQRARSRALPDFDIALAQRCVLTGDQNKALKLLRRALKH